MTDILDDLRRDLAYAQSVGTLHAVVRLSVGLAVIAEVERLRRQVAGKSKLLERAACRGWVEQMASKEPDLKQVVYDLERG